MTKIFGDFSEVAFSSEEYLILGFSPSSIPLQQRWRNNGLSADFLADYMTTFFPNDTKADDIEKPDEIKQNEIRSAVSYIANELLENAMKFHDPNSQYPISIQLQLHSNHIVFSVTNSISPKAAETFQIYLQKLIHSDPQELYIQQLEDNAQEENYSSSSGLGLLTMINDYMAKVGWKFQTIKKDQEILTVTTMVQFFI
ncbi:conserved hypothetical protein [Beggiatoa sp. PS]|nr:conserved hypothetical protein [Beggiatoa sp. PS]